MSGRAQRSEAGTTLIETLVASAITLVVVTGLLGLFDLKQRVSHDQGDVIVMQSNARAGLEFMARDIAEAGYGLTNDTALSAAGVVWAGAVGSEVGDAITLWNNPQNLSTKLLLPLATEGDDLVVTSLAGYVVGQEAVIVGVGSDGNLHHDWFPVVALDSGSGVFTLKRNGAALSTRYLAGASVAPARRVSYYIASSGGRKQLMRRDGVDAPYAVAEEVSGLSISYYDGAQPKAKLEPFDDVADRIALRSVKLTLTVETSRAARDTGKRRSFDLTSEITPRNLAYLGGA